MPSPFPGMDPYLEHPTRWSGVHQGLITNARAALNAMLPSRYVADAGERLYIVQPERSIYPDGVVVERTPPPPGGSADERETAGGMSSDPRWLVSVQPVEMREPYIQILATADESQVITVIEILSPSNKLAGSSGRELYQTKQRELLRSPTHLIEIDLLREGEHTVAPPQETLLKMGRWDYLASLHRGGQVEQYEVWPIAVSDRLPRILVPLGNSDPDLVLDLQALFDRCYDEGAYARRLDYCREPRVALGDEDREWADRLLRERGLRS